MLPNNIFMNIYKKHKLHLVLGTRNDHGTCFWANVMFAIWLWNIYIISVVKFNFEGGIFLPKAQLGVLAKFMRYVIVILNVKK